MKKITKVFWVFQICFSVLGAFNYDHDKAHNILGFDPKITLISGCLGQECITRATLYVHGWRENKDRVSDLKDCLGNNIISYNFQDAVAKIGESPALKRSNFGQTPDIETTLFALKACVDNDIKILDIYAYSRGGAAIINTLAALNKSLSENSHKSKIMNSRS